MKAGAQEDAGAWPVEPPPPTPGGRGGAGGGDSLARGPVITSAYLPCEEGARGHAFSGEYRATTSLEVASTRHSDGMPRRYAPVRDAGGAVRAALALLLPLAHIGPAHAHGVRLAACAQRGGHLLLRIHSVDLPVAQQRLTVADHLRGAMRG